MVGRRVKLNGRDAVEIKFRTVADYYWESKGRYYHKSLNREYGTPLTKTHRISQKDYNAALFLQ